MKWRLISILGHGRCQRCGSTVHHLNFVEIPSGITEICWQRCYCDDCLMTLGPSDGDPRD